MHHHGRAIVIAAAAYGGFIALAGLMPSIWLVGVFLAFGGAADMISGVFRGTVWSQTIPEAMRGRLAGIEMLSYSVGPLGGQVRAGVTADLWSVRGAITSGGLACVAGVGTHRAVAAATSGPTTPAPTSTPSPSAPCAERPARAESATRLERRHHQGTQRAGRGEGPRDVELHPERLEVGADGRRGP